MIRFIPLFLAVLFFPLGVASVHSAIPTHEVLHAFTRGPGYPERSGLVLGPDGYLWGLASWGGAYLEGAVYKVKVDGSDWQIVHSFGNGGRDYLDKLLGGPEGDLVSDGEGYLWGAFKSSQLGVGSIFKVDASSGAVTTVVEFTGASTFADTVPNGPFVDDGAGNLWGTTYDGGIGSGSIIKVNRASGQFTTVLSFDGSKGYKPTPGLVRDDAGNFWGTTLRGTPYGTVFKFSPGTGVLKTIVEFTGISGANRGYLPGALVLDDSKKWLWGTAQSGGTNSEGTVFKVNVETGVMTTVVDFSRQGLVNKGARPMEGLVSDGNGNFWGSTQQGGVEDLGTVFKINVATGELTTVYEFTKAAKVGWSPRSKLVADGAGYLWGTTPGGDPFWGAAYKINIETGELTRVLRFDGYGPGERPAGGLLSDGSGRFLATSILGGRTRGAAIYEFDEKTGEVTTVVEFERESASTAGGVPSELVRDASGNIWGIASGAATGDNLVFKYDRAARQLRTVVEFGGSNRGSGLNGRLVRDGNGFLWGATSYSSTVQDRSGTIFKISEATGEVTTVVEFAEVTAAQKGANPVGSLVADGEGFFWGVTRSGGAANGGTVFKLNIASGELTTMSEFDSPLSVPIGIVNDGAGSFIGQTLRGGSNGTGTIFKVDAQTGNLVTVIEFEAFDASNPERGVYPGETLVSDGTGFFWGITQLGGLHGHGTVFKINPSTGAFVTVIQFTGSGNQAQSGTHPRGRLIISPNGDVYGVTAEGGPDGGGTIFRIRGAVPRQLAQSVMHRAGSRGSGSAVPGEAEGTTFVSAGEPAIDLQSAAFLSTIRNPEGKQLSAIFGGNAIIARAGQTAPGAEPATFKSFDEPLVSSAGVAFGAKLNDGRIGIWTTAFTGGLQLVKLSKSAAPGLPESKVASIMSYSLRGEEIIALLKLQRGPGGVTSANDMTLTRYVSGSESRLLSKGQGIPVGDVIPQPLLSFSAFTPSTFAPGQDRSHAEGVVGAKGTVRISDRSLREVVLRARADGAVEVVEMSNPAVKNSPAFLAKSFGLPAVGAAEGLAYLATAHARAAARDQAIATDLLESESDDQALEVLEGEQAAPGAEPATFLAMSDPVVNDQQRVAFLASLQGQGITSKNNRGLWWGDATAGLSLVARLDDFAPDRDGAPSAAKFAKIERFGLPDGWDAGPLFIATLAGPRGSNVRSANNRALYGRDSDGKLRELLRTGDQLEYAGELKKIRSFTALSGGKPVGGRRNFTSAGHVAARAVFTDNSTGIIHITVP